MMLRIKESEDFGLGFNCMTRLYMDRYDEEILVDMIKLCEDYLKWFSHRTIICSLRDLIREYPFSWNEEPVPESQVERYEALIKDLIRQAIGKEKKRGRYRELREIVNRVSNDIGVTNSRWGKEKNFYRDTFYQWVIENGLTDEVVIKEVKEDEMLPLKKKYVPLFYKVCNYIIDYSYGRHTYMPSTCRSFVKANMELMSDEALMGIVDYLKKRNAHIPEVESAIDKIDSDNWIYMQEDLEAELLTRQMFYKAQEKAGDMQELKMLLDELLDLFSLHTQKNCLHMYHQLMGIERYLLSIQGDGNAKSLLKQMELAKKKLGEKRVEFFEKEEGHLYEKIGEGVYQRKR
ncbi:MAG: hypothetical protein ACI4GD_05115 [Lachnospiraceae bacterium]